MRPGGTPTRSAQIELRAGRPRFDSEPTILQGELAAGGREVPSEYLALLPRASSATAGSASPSVYPAHFIPNPTEPEPID